MRPIVRVIIQDVNGHERERRDIEVTENYVETVFLCEREKPTDYDVEYDCISGRGHHHDIDDMAHKLHIHDTEEFTLLKLRYG